MRITVMAAILCLISAANLSASPNADVGTRQRTNIPAQELGSALFTLEKHYNLEVIYVAEDVRDVRTQGATGQLTSEETLKQLLVGTGLTYRYVDDKTITILPLSTTAQAPTPAAAEGKDSVAAGARGENDKQSFWQRFRLTQSEQENTSNGDSESQQMPQAKTGEIQEIVVTAQKRTERLQDVPISISVMSGENLEHPSIQGIADALRRIPGVDALPSVVGGGTQLNVRGVGTDIPLFSGSSPVAYYVDSVPFGLVKSAIVPDSSTYDLERVEVLRGPQGTLYGATALNGAVRVLTHDADHDGFEFKARTGFSGTEGGEPSYRGDVAVNIPIIEDKLAVRLVAGHQFLGGWIDSPTGNNVNSTTSDNLRLKINAQPTEQLSVGVSYWRSRIEADAPSTADFNDTTPLTRAQPLNTDFDSFGLKVGYDFSAFTLSSVSSFLTFENSGVNDFGGGFALFTGLESEVFAQEINLLSTGDGPWRWSLGAFYRDAEDRLDQKFFTEPPPAITNFVDYKDTSESAAVYGEIGRQLTDELELTVGARYFHDEVEHSQNALDLGQAPGTPLFKTGTTFEATTPRVVLTWKPSGSLTAYASYSEGFRSGFPQNANTLIVHPTYPALEPDTLRNYEIGAKGHPFKGHFWLPLANKRAVAT